MQTTVTLKEVLDSLDRGDSFAIAFVTDDQERGTGGEWIEIKEAVKHDVLTKSDRRRLTRAQPRAELLKNPNHYQHSTRNIILPNGEIRKFSIRLVRRFAAVGTTNLFTKGKVVM